MPETREIATRAMAEIIAIAAARGIDLGADATERTLTATTAPADSTSSLQRDVMEGKPSELDAQLGAMVRMARESGVPTRRSASRCYTLCCLRSGGRAGCVRPSTRQ